MSDVGVIEGGEQLGLALETGEALVVLRQFRGQGLIATSRSSFVSRARNTSPIPPAPSLALTS